MAEPALLAPREEVEASPRSRALDGAVFAFAESADVPALWGDDGMVAWAAGEPLMVVGPDGVGKTTLQQRLLLARLGLGDSLLGYPVVPAERPILYIAADRPRQAQRSFRRMVDEARDAATLAANLIVWKGPLPFDLGTTPEQLAPFVASFGVGDVFLDSLKDLALDPAKDEVGSRVNRAFQEVIASGVELCVSHHQRKAQQGGAKTAKPRRLADVYGSRWLTAGMGSVILLWGEPGDPVVELSHLKQPAEEIGPFKVVHDHRLGLSSVYEPLDLEQVVATTYGGVTAKAAATALYGTATPTAAETERARRRLDKLVRQGTVTTTVLNGETHYLEKRA